MWFPLLISALFLGWAAHVHWEADPRSQGDWVVSIISWGLALGISAISWISWGLG